MQWELASLRGLRSGQPTEWGYLFDEATVK